MTLALPESLRSEGGNVYIYSKDKEEDEQEEEEEEGGGGGRGNVPQEHVPGIHTTTQ